MNPFTPERDAPFGSSAILQPLEPCTSGVRRAVGSVARYSEPNRAHKLGTKPSVTSCVSVVSGGAS